MALLSILGGIGSALGILGSGISLFSGGKKGSAVSSAGSAVSNAASSLSGVSAQQAGVQGAAEQAALSRDVFEYQKQLQQQIFQREDDSVQRRVRDLEAAGLSPTLAAGSSAGAGQAIKVDTPQSAALLKSQALAQGIQNMLSISQAKANIALTEAQAKKTSAEAGVIHHDLEWYEGAALPSGTHSGIPFLINSIASIFGTSSVEASAILKNVFYKIADKLGINVDDILNGVSDPKSNLIDEVLDDISEKVSQVKASIGSSFSSSMKVLGSKMFSFDGFSDQDIENVLEKTFTPRISSSTNKFFQNYLNNHKKPLSNGGRVW